MEKKGPWFRAQPQLSHLPLTQLERQSALGAHIVYCPLISSWDADVLVKVSGWPMNPACQSPEIPTVPRVPRLVPFRHALQAFLLCTFTCVTYSSSSWLSNRAQCGAMASEIDRTER